MLYSHLSKVRRQWDLGYGPYKRFAWIGSLVQISGYLAWQIADRSDASGELRTMTPEFIFCKWTEYAIYFGRKMNKDQSWRTRQEMCLDYTPAGFQYLHVMTNSEPGTKEDQVLLVNSPQGDRSQQLSKNTRKSTSFSVSLSRPW